MKELLFKCTIPGRARILKNNKKLIRNNRTGRMFPVSSDRYKRWEMFASIFVMRAKITKEINFPVVMTARFYFKDHQHEPDLSNLYQGIEDILQHCDIIKDDKLIYSHDGSQKIFGDNTERTEIEIYRFTDEQEKSTGKDSVSESEDERTQARNAKVPKV